MELAGIIIGLVIGLVVGGVACWALRGSRISGELARQREEHARQAAEMQQAAESQAGALRLEQQQTLADKDAEIGGLNLAHQQALGAKDEEIAAARLVNQQALSVKEEEIAGLKGQLEQAATAQQLLEQAKTQFAEQAKLTSAEALKGNNESFLKLANENLGKKLEEAQAELNTRHSEFQALVKPLSENYSQLTETFQAATNRALANNTEQFLELANQNLGKTLESAKGEFQKRHTDFQTLVKPLIDNYARLNPNIEALVQQNQLLMAETGKLSSALTDNRQVGRWGEMQLRRVVELAGMADYCDFAEQGTIDSTQGGRPDLIVKLPEGRSIVVDAKASTIAYLEAQQAENDESANSSLIRHAQAMRTQVDSLVSRNYGANLDGYLDFVVMFVPGDQFLAAALSSNPGLVEYAMAKRVAIATPSSLISMLWAVAQGWQQHRLAANAAEIKQVGEEMHKRLMTFINHYQKVGRELNQAVEAYNSSVGSFDRQVAPQGRRFAGLLSGNEDAFKGPESLETSSRVSTYANESELEAAADD